MDKQDEATEASEVLLPDGLVGRLPTYLESLLHLNEEAVDIVTSARLSRMTGLNSALIRRDLSRFGRLGHRAKGYEVSELIYVIRHALRSGSPRKIALVGAGRFGAAVAQYSRLSAHGFAIAAVFDANHLRVGKRLGGTAVRHTDDIRGVVTEQDIDLAVVAVAYDSAQDTVDTLVRAGVKEIVNYSHARVSAPSGVRVHNIDPVSELLSTLHYLSHQK